MTTGYSGKHAVYHQPTPSLATGNDVDFVRVPRKQLELMIQDLEPVNIKWAKQKMQSWLSCTSDSVERARKPSLEYPS